jgi:transcriptional regulator with XRE-family HTH domain
MQEKTNTTRDTIGLAKLLREARKARAWSLRRAASETGISNGYLSLLERGRIATPSPSYLLSLSNSYGLPYPRLLIFAGHPAPAGSDAQRSGMPETEAVARFSRRQRADESVTWPSNPPSYGTRDQAAWLPTSGGAPRNSERSLLEEVVMLSPEDASRVRSFIAGLRAARS